MGSIDKRQIHLYSDEKLVRVMTAELKDRLNLLYNRLHESSLTGDTKLRHFDSLWDLKELALLDRRQSVEVPESWLVETDVLTTNSARNKEISPA